MNSSKLPFDELLKRATKGPYHVEHSHSDPGLYAIQGPKLPDIARCEYVEADAHAELIVRLLTFAQNGGVAAIKEAQADVLQSANRYHDGSLGLASDSLKKALAHLDPTPPTQDGAKHAGGRREGNFMNDEILERINEVTVPTRYLGENACGQFLFAQGKPFTTHIFSTLEEAMNDAVGRTIVIKGSSMQSPRFHAGYKAGLFGKPYDPCTRITDGAPRELSEKERQEYAHGYMHGIQMRSTK